MVRMTGPAFGAEGDDRRWLHRVDDRGEPPAQLCQHLERREPAIGQPDDVKLLHAHPLRRALGFLRAFGRERRAGRDLREVAYPLRAVGGDHEMRLATLARET